MFRHPTLFAIAFVIVGTAVEMVRASNLAALGETHVVPAAFAILAHLGGGFGMLLFYGFALVAWGWLWRRKPPLRPWPLSLVAGAAAGWYFLPIMRALPGLVEQHQVWGGLAALGYIAALPAGLAFLVYVVGVVMLREPAPKPDMPPGFPPGGFTG